MTGFWKVPAEACGVVPAWPLSVGVPIAWALGGVCAGCWAASVGVAAEVGVDLGSAEVVGTDGAAGGGGTVGVAVPPASWLPHPAIMSIRSARNRTRNVRALSTGRPAAEVLREAGRHH